jgi:hypothetical protein
MKKQFTCSLALLVTLSTMLFSSTSNAQNTIYASPSGSSGNAGTEASPKDISTAISNITEGTTVILLDGTYNLSNDLYVWQKKGTSSKKITIKAKNKHKAILKGSASKITDYYAVLYLSTCKYVTVDGLTVMNVSGSKDIASGIRLGDGCDIVTVKNCKVYGHGGAGITCEGGDNVTVEDNAVYNNCSRNEINTSGISFYKLKAKTNTGSYWGAVIRRNKLWGNKCNLPYKYGNESNVNPTDGNGIILDLLDDPGSTKYGKRVLIENNLCYDNGGSGIKCYKSSLARIINNTVYHNNTILNKYSKHSNEIWVFETQGVNGVYNEGIYNNVVVADNGLTKNVDQAMAVDFDLSKVYNNHLVGVGAKFNNYNYSTSDFPTSNTVKAISNQGYPKFVDAGARNFRLQSSSPLIDKYKESYGPTIDIEWTSRPQGSGTDIGCSEYKASSSSRSAATAIITSEESPAKAASSPRLLTNMITNDNLSLTGGSGNYKIALFNNSGVNVMSKTNITSGNNINVSNLPAGLYTIIIDDGQSKTTKRLVIAK